MSSNDAFNALQLIQKTKNKQKQNRIGTKVGIKIYFYKQEIPHCPDSCINKLFHTYITFVTLTE